MQPQLPLRISYAAVVDVASCGVIPPAANIAKRQKDTTDAHDVDAVVNGAAIVNVDPTGVAIVSPIDDVVGSDASWRYC